MTLTVLSKFLFDRDGAMYNAIRFVRFGVRYSGAWCYRKIKRFDQIVGITGSSAKSTTTALVAEIFQQFGRVHRGLGKNSYHAIIRNFWRCSVGTRYWVQEISGGKPGEAGRSASFIGPSIAIVTTIQMDHIKRFDDEDHIAFEKGRILDALPAEGVAVLNADDPRVLAMGERCRKRKIITFGKSEDADIRLLSWSEGLPDKLALEITDGEDTVSLNTRFIGSRWTLAILAAVASARAAGISMRDCKTAIENHNPEFTKDSLHIQPDGTAIALDSWKAGLWTVPTSIETVRLAKSVRKTMIVGTLSDYRGSSGPKYRNTAKAALDAADKIIFYGPNSDRVIRMVNDYPDRVFIFHKIVELNAHLLSEAIPGELIYVKASSVDHLERLLFERINPVSCWLDKCGRVNTCRECKHLYGTRSRTKRIISNMQL